MRKVVFRSVVCGAAAMMLYTYIYFVFIRRTLRRECRIITLFPLILEWWIVLR